MHSFSYLLLIFVVLACAKSQKKEDYSALAKSYIKKMKERDPHVKKTARAALKEAKKEKHEKKMKKLTKTKEMKLKELVKRTRNLSKSKLQNKINTFEADVVAQAKKISKETIVAVPTTSGNEANVSLAGLNRAVNTNAASVNITTINGLSYEVPTLAARDIAVAASQKVLRKAEAIAQKNIVKEARSNPAAADKLMKLLFNKIYIEEPQRARQKAFSRVERMMGLEDGLLYNQYKQGVIKPTLNPPQKVKTAAATEVKDGQDLLKADLASNKGSTVDAKLAQVISTYDVINNMDLADKEQEIPETLLNVINKNLRTETNKKESETGEKSTLTKLKTFLFGEF